MFWRKLLLSLVLLLAQGARVDDEEASALESQPAKEAHVGVVGGKRRRERDEARAAKSTSKSLKEEKQEKQQRHAEKEAARRDVPPRPPRMPACPLKEAEETAKSIKKVDKEDDKSKEDLLRVAVESDRKRDAAEEKKAQEEMEEYVKKFQAQKQKDCGATGKDAEAAAVRATKNGKRRSHKGDSARGQFDSGPEPKDVEERIVRARLEKKGAAEQLYRAERDLSRNTAETQRLRLAEEGARDRAKDAQTQVDQAEDLMAASRTQGELAEAMLRRAERQGQQASNEEQREAAEAEIGHAKQAQDQAMEERTKAKEDQAQSETMRARAQQKARSDFLRGQHAAEDARSSLEEWAAAKKNVAMKVIKERKAQLDLAVAERDKGCAKFEAAECEEKAAASTEAAAYASLSTDCQRTMAARSSLDASTALARLANTKAAQKKEEEATTKVSKLEAQEAKQKKQALAAARTMRAADDASLAEGAAVHTATQEAQRRREELFEARQDALREARLVSERLWKASAKESAEKERRAESASELAGKAAEEAKSTRKELETVEKRLKQARLETHDLELRSANAPDKPQVFLTYLDAIRQEGSAAIARTDIERRHEQAMEASRTAKAKSRQLREAAKDDFRRQAELQKEEKDYRTRAYDQMELEINNAAEELKEARAAKTGLVDSLKQALIEENKHKEQAAVARRLEGHNREQSLEEAARLAELRTLKEPPPSALIAAEMTRKKKAKASCKDRAKAAEEKLAAERDCAAAAELKQRLGFEAESQHAAARKVRRLSDALLAEKHALAEEEVDDAADSKHTAEIKALRFKQEEEEVAGTVEALHKKKAKAQREVKIDRDELRRFEEGEAGENAADALEERQQLQKQLAEDKEKLARHSKELKEADAERRKVKNEEGSLAEKYRAKATLMQESEKRVAQQVNEDAERQKQRATEALSHLKCAEERDSEEAETACEDRAQALADVAAWQERHRAAVAVAEEARAQHRLALATRLGEEADDRLETNARDRAFALDRRQNMQEKADDSEMQLNKLSVPVEGLESSLSEGSRTAV
eukprot:TRINITY_DN17473_c0_g1_i1.p1 TRINITY_DN17473_c0_g1~~TRINITY_DN17473_c0_g1_i1.p1  ORF type:complete len:1057 (-),score=424.79 TRINITY_DN17473_c0_g1_i1:13-3183(-)